VWSLLRSCVLGAAQAGFEETVGCGLPCVQDERTNSSINPLNAKLNPICPLLEIFGAHHILHVSS